MKSGEVDLFEAKTHLSALIDRVTRGEQITITRHGTAVARLVCADEQRRRDPKEAVMRIRELRRGLALKGENIRSLIEEGRR
ncbi:MAG: type II toxin-antitoxin system Phd/YefM family antitoxin [Candidatus Binataceae bacterium]